MLYRKIVCVCLIFVLIACGSRVVVNEYFLDENTYVKETYKKTSKDSFHRFDVLGVYSIFDEDRLEYILFDYIAVGQEVRKGNLVIDKKINLLRIHGWSETGKSEDIKLIKDYEEERVFDFCKRYIIKKGLCDKILYIRCKTGDGWQDYCLTKKI